VGQVLCGREPGPQYIMESIQDLNKWLRSYGLVSDGNPKYRLVHSESEYEKRFGDFEDRTPEGFLIRKIGEVREVLKYAYISPPTWILEQHHWNEANPELKAKFSYEPLWAFHDTKGDAIYPVRLALEHLLYLHTHKFKNPRKTEKSAYEEDQAKLRLTKIREREILDNNLPEMVSRLHDGSAVIVGDVKNGE
jgi:hypothetical protein